MGHCRHNLYEPVGQRVLRVSELIAGGERDYIGVEPADDLRIVEVDNTVEYAVVSTDAEGIATGEPH